MRFVQGEIARLVLARRDLGHDVPRETTILFRGPVKAGQMYREGDHEVRSIVDFDYIVDSPEYIRDHGEPITGVLAMDWQLAKLDDPLPGLETEETEELEETK
jgi:hypothetical protein